MDAFLAEEPGAQPTVESFRFDFSRPFGHLFNLTACDVFTRAFLHAVENGDFSQNPIPQEQRTRHQVSKCLKVHFTYLHDEYAKKRTKAELHDVKDRAGVNARRGQVCDLSAVRMGF